MGVLTTIDRAALAAYCQAYGRWVEAEERLRETPMLFKTPSGYVQQSPLLGIINKQLELMGRYLVELGMTPASRSRVWRHSPLGAGADRRSSASITDPPERCASPARPSRTRGRMKRTSCNELTVHLPRDGYGTELRNER